MEIGQYNKHQLNPKEKIVRFDFFKLNPTIFVTQRIFIKHLCYLTTHLVLLFLNKIKLILFTFVDFKEW